MQKPRCSGLGNQRPSEGTYALVHMHKLTRSPTHLSLGGRHPLVALILRLARRLLHPDDDGDARVGEEQHEQRKEVLQNHDHQAAMDTTPQGIISFVLSVAQTHVETTVVRTSALFCFL